MIRKTAINSALYFLKFRPRSVFEIQRKLKQKKFPDVEIDKTINLLKEQGFLNDLEFARMWIRNRNLLKPMGKRLLFLELRKLGVESEIIEKALEIEDLDESSKAKMVFEKKKKYLSKLPTEEFKKKMIGLMSRRGFSWDIIKQVLEK